MAGISDFILTLDSDAEEDIPVVRLPKSNGKKSKKSAPEPVVADEDVALLNPEFSFDVAGGLDSTWNIGEDEDVVKAGSKPVYRFCLVCWAMRI